ncbi:hypothetical protein KI387_041116 [Taxus chinensis]|uniref:Uncharacterized protein n=1 Tax=Taxus chinensis TaxID=29808 RepID=A0AA38C2N2_TAXCH|nr:hypothetical protein KI387_041116 [Taxus chinensis]
MTNVGKKYQASYRITNIDPWPHHTVMPSIGTWSWVEMVNGQRQEPEQQERQHQLQQRSCRVQSLRAQQPSETIRSEAGIVELSSRQENDELDCAGVEFIRETIERDGLSLPRYANTPKLAYIVEGG